MWLDLDDVTASLDVKRLEELYPSQVSVSKKKAKIEVKETKTLLDHNRAKNLGILVYLCVCVCVYVCASYLSYMMVAGHFNYSFIRYLHAQFSRLIG